MAFDIDIGSFASDLDAIIGGGTQEKPRRRKRPVPTPSPNTRTVPVSPRVRAILERMRGGTSSQESGGSTTIVNPDSGATGEFQVIPENIPKWTQKYYGRRLNQNEFRKNAEAQRAVFDGEMGSYIRRALRRSKGDEDLATRMAAAAWYGGLGAMNRYDDPTPQYTNGKKYPSFREYTSSVLNRTKGSNPRQDGFADFLKGLDEIVPAGQQVDNFRTGLETMDQQQPARSATVPSIDDFTKDIDEIVPKAIAELSTPAPNEPVPETMPTIQAQLDSTLDEGSPRAAVLLTNPGQLTLLGPGAVKPFVQVETPGGLLLVNPAKATAAGITDIPRYIAENGFAELIGKAENQPDTTSGMALKTTDASGNELSVSKVSPTSIQTQAELDRAQFPNAANQEVVDIRDAAAQREEDLRKQIVTLGGVAGGVEFPPPSEPPVRTISDPDLQAELAALDERMRPQQTPPEINQAETSYQQYLKDTGITDSDEARKDYNEQVVPTLNRINREVAAENRRQAETYNAEVRRNNTQTRRQKPPVANRVPGTWKLAAKDLTDQELAKTDITYNVDLSNVKGDKGAYADRAAKAALMRDFGLTQEQVNQIVVTESADLGPDDKQVNVVINRGRLAQLIGLDKVRSDFRNEQADIAIANPQEVIRPELDLSNPNRKRSGDELMDQARLNIEMDPFSAGTDEAVRQEYERLKRVTPAEEERQALETTGEILKIFDTTGGVSTGVIKGVGWLADIASGIQKVSPLGLLDFALGTRISGADQTSKFANSARIIARSSKREGILYDITEAVGQAAVQVPVYVGASMLPGGAVVAFAATEGLGSLGRGENLAQAIGQTYKGAALGLVFSAAPRIGRFVEGQTSRAFVNPVFDAGKTPAADIVLASKILGTTAEIGTIAGGTYAVQRAAGESKDDAFNAAIVNALFGLTRLGDMKGLVGKTFRMYRGGQKKDVTIDPDGSVKVLKGEAPAGAVDAEMNLDNVIDVEMDASGVYRAKSDTAPARERETPYSVGNRGGRIETSAEPRQLAENNPLRIETADPAAVQSVSIDTRAKKIIETLKGKDAMSAAELHKATRINEKNVEQALLKLYGARMVEILPDNRVRLINEQEAAKATSLFEKAKNYGQTPPAVSQPPAPVGTSTNVPTTTIPSSSEQVTGTTQAQVGGTPTAQPNAAAPEFTPEQQAEAAQSAGLSTRQVSVEQQRRDAGSFTADGVTYERQQPVTSPDEGGRFGQTGKVKFAENETPDFRYRLIEADQLQPAHINGTPNLANFLPEAQPKARIDKASVKAADRIASSINFAELGENPLAYSGAPIVNSRGEVIQGNNRSAGIKLNYSSPDMTYKRELAANAEKFGFSPTEVEMMDKPVLVRQVDASDDEAIRLGQFDAKDVESGGTHRIEALKLSNRIPHADKGKILGDVFLNADDEASLNQLIRDNEPVIVKQLEPFLTDTQKQSLFGGDKHFTPAAVKDIEETFQTFLFAGGSHSLPGLFKELPVRAQQGLTASLPKIFGVPENVSLVPEIQNAIIAANQFEESKVPLFDDWKRQPDMFTGEMAPQEIYTPAELAIAKALIEAKTIKEVKGLFADYATLANGSEADLFNEARPGISKAEAVKELFNVEHRERELPERVETSDDVTPTGADTVGGGRANEEARPVEEESKPSEPLSVPTEPKVNLETPQPQKSTDISTNVRRPTLHGLPPQELTPLMQARVLYAKEQGRTPADIAELLNLTPEQVESVGTLPPVGSGGQMSHKLIQAMVPAKQATAAEREEKISIVNDLAAELGLTDARLSRDVEPAEVKAASDLIRLAIANEMGRDRGSHMTPEDWLKWLDAHGDRLEHDTIAAVIDAFDHQLDHAKNKVDPFVHDKALVTIVEDLHRRFGLTMIRSFRDIPRDTRAKILQLGYSYGLKRTAIDRAFSQSFLDLASEESAEAGRRREGPSDQTEVAPATTAEAGPRNPQKLTQTNKPRRAWRAGMNQAEIVFDSELQRDLYDYAANEKYIMRGGQNKTSNRAVRNVDAQDLAQRAGVPVSGLYSKAVEVYDDVRAQMKGVQDGETRQVRDNSDRGISFTLLSPTGKAYALRGEMRQLAAKVRKLSGLPIKSLASTAEFHLAEDGVVEVNPAGMAILRSAIGEFQPDPGLVGGFHARPGGASGIRGILSKYEGRHGGRLTQLVKVIDRAMDDGYNDLTVVLHDPANPEASRFSRQEELGHRANSRSGAREALTKEFSEQPAIARDLESLRGYSGLTLVGKLDEIVAKNFRADAEIELDKTTEQVAQSLDALLTALDGVGLDLDEYARQIESVSERGREFASKARQLAVQPRPGLGEAESSRAQKGDTPAEGSPHGRKGGSRGGSESPETNTDRLARLRRAELSAASGQGSRQPLDPGRSDLTPQEQKYIQIKTRNLPELRKDLEDEIQFARMADGDRMTIKDYAIDLANVPKALKASMDLSAFRQGGLTSLAHPKIAARAFVKQLTVLPPKFGAEAYEKFERDLNLHPFIELAEDSGLYLATLAGEAIAEREEQFMSRLLGENRFFTNNKFEAARKLATFGVRASERAFKTFLDDLRINTFAHLAKALHNANMRTGREDSIEQYRGLARFLNYATGRGDLGKFNDAAPYLNASFFSARYWASRLQVLNPLFYAKLPPGTRALVLKDLMTTIGAMAAIGILLKMAGGKIEWDDPNDPDTLKVGFGNYTYDITFGLIKHLRYAARMIMATQEERPADKMTYLTERYVRSSSAPLPGGAWSALSGTNFVGEPTSFKEEALGLFRPITVDNFADAAKADGTIGLIKMSPEFFGISTTRYKEEEELRQAIADERARMANAKTPEEKKEAARRVQAWAKLLKRQKKYEARDRRKDLMPSR